MITLKGLTDEDLINYKKPSMLVVMPNCDWKCEREHNAECQNSALAKTPTIEFSIEDLVVRYLKNPITKAVVFGGLEPLDDFNDVLIFIKRLRDFSDDDVVIYTGYTEEEVKEGNFGSAVADWQKETNKGLFQTLVGMKNIVIKFGRFIPNDEGVWDKELGVNLASRNQYGKRY